MNVLLVEDDPLVSKAFTSILEESGFRVTAVANAADGFAAINSAIFHAVVLDLILPGTEGTTFYDRLAAEQPEMATRVLFVTGWAHDPRSRKLLEYTGRPVLAKPVEAVDLVKAVRRIAEAPVI